MKEKVAVYPGFFDPFTKGHLNIVERGMETFDRVIVAVAADSPKKSFFTAEERLDVIRSIFKGQKRVEVDHFSGLFVNYLTERGLRIVLRGLRTVSDFEYEFQMALANRTMAENVETVFMMTEGRFSYLSSTLIKEIARLGGDISEMVPPQVADLMKGKYDV